MIALLAIFVGTGCLFAPAAALLAAYTSGVRERSGERTATGTNHIRK